MTARESVAVLVAHPDDETLWAGGTLLSEPSWSPFVWCACRAHDADRAPKFRRVLERLGAQGAMADLDDSPEQPGLADELVEQSLLEHLPKRRFDRILTHSPLGEYTRHRRHNGGVWPFVCGFYVAACVAVGRHELAAQKLEALAELVKPWHENACAWGFNEQVRAQTGKPIGRDWQTWSAAMFLYACECVATRSTPDFGRGSQR